MIDIQLTWDPVQQAAAFSFAGNDLVSGQSLLTPVLISLFTDARAHDDDILPNDRDTDKRGWWGDATNLDKPKDTVGSRLWLLERSTNTAKNLIAAKLYVKEALQWLIDEGVAMRIDVATEAQPMAKNPGMAILAFSVVITKPNGTQETYKFQQDWEATLNAL